ncbi:MAG: sulfotransferase [Gammaproteobacteria bacterium]|nr:MAG: sulfotransferase [Gammaproteobacteria bacterium]
MYPRSKKIKRLQFIKGIEFRPFIRLLSKARFRVGIRYLPDVVSIINISSLSGVYGLVDWIRYGKKIESIDICKPPIFIIGHCRSGTTYLHKLLSLDPRLTYPTMFQCTFPKAFLSLDKSFKKKFDALLPDTRRIDNVLLGADEPFEEEFALLKLTLLSPMIRFVFPNILENVQDYTTFKNASEQERQSWKKALHWFAKKITYTENKQIVFKSPLNTFRVPMILDVFPDARFIYIHRQPYEVYVSTRHLIRVMFDQNNLHKISYAGFDDAVTGMFKAMHDTIEHDKHIIPKENYCEVPYRDVVREPLITLGKIYRSLGLDWHQDAKECIRDHLKLSKSYKKNEYIISDKEKESFYDKCQAAFKVHDYAK